MLYIKGLSFRSKDYTKELKLSSVHVFWTRLASFVQLGHFSEPQVASNFQNRTNEPIGLEHKIYTMMKGRGIIYGDHTVPVTICSEVQYVP